MWTRRRLVSTTSRARLVTAQSGPRAPTPRRLMSGNAAGMAAFWSSTILSAVYLIALAGDSGLKSFHGPTDVAFSNCRYSRTDKENSGHSRVTATHSANYLDMRAVSSLEARSGYSPGQLLHIQHVKDESRDSIGSRSSGHGSLDGQCSENFAARTDTMSSEGFVSGDDRHARHAAKEHAPYSKGKARFFTSEYVLCS